MAVAKSKFKNNKLMKKYIFLLILIINISCNAQKQSTMIPEINNKFEQFDSVKYNRLKHENVNTISIKLENGTYIEMIKVKSGSAYYETPPNSYFKIFKDYYSSGKIKNKGLALNSWGDFKKEIWYEFDEQGKLIRETDYDKPFKFTFEDILKFCEKQGIKIDKGPISQNGWHNLISRILENRHPFWKIERLKKTNLIEIIKLDGITGKIISVETQEYINN